MKPNSKLELIDGATIHVRDGSVLIIDDGAELNVNDYSQIIIEEGVTLINRNTQTSLGLRFDQTTTSSNTANVLVNGTLEYQNGANMNMDGWGFYDFENNGTLVLSTTSVVNLQGNGANVLMLRIGNVLSIDGHSVEFGNGEVDYLAASKLLIENLDFYSDNVFYKSMVELMDADKAIETLDLTYFEMHDSHVTGFPIGVDIHNSSLSTFPHGFSGSDVLFDYCTTGVMAEELNDLVFNGGTFYNCTTGINESNITKTTYVNGEIYVDNAEGTTGIITNQCEKVSLDGVSIHEVETGCNITETGFFILQNDVKVYNISTGITGTESRIFMRNNSYIDHSYVAGIHLDGHYDILNQTYTALVTMGDEGCAGITNHIGDAIEGTDVLLDIDQLWHQESMTTPNQNFFWNTDEEIGPTHFFNICYDNTPIIKISMQNNNWGVIDPTTSQYMNIRNNHTCLPQSYPIIALAYLPIPNVAITECSPLYALRINDGGNNEYTPQTNDDIVKAEFEADDFVFVTSRDSAFVDNFIPISVLNISYDTTTQLWSAVSVNNQTYILSDSSIQRILISKNLKGVYNTGMRTGEIRDIFYHPDFVSFGDSKLTLYPNPSNDNFTIYSFGKKINYICTDITGRKILESTTATTNPSIIALTWEKGIYLFHVKDETGKEIGILKAVVQ